MTIITIPEDLVYQLTDIYQKEETWHRTKLSIPESIKYFEKMIGNNRIIWVYDYTLKGYVEFWHITFPQLSQIIRGEFKSGTENVNDGEICYVANVWVQPMYRKSEVFRELHDRLMEASSQCDYIAGESNKDNRKLKIHNIRR